MSQFYLMPDLYVELNAKTNFIEEKRNDRTKKTTKVYEKMYLKESSPLTFRNFLTFSNFEDFSQEFHIDNAFYISKIKEMDTRHFSYDKLVDVGKRKEYYRNTKDPAIRFTPFKRDASFYIFIPEEGSVECRKKKLKL